ncbi:MAG: O-antigen ligase family protein [Caldilineales bacterium]|nr:O-antigen ligase family protein [Caldilineales bacterium]MCW5857964.1 O-antigen ligase family protein [Caldilineales bacterium]
MAETTEAGVQKMAGAGSARSRTADVAAALAAILFLATGIMGVWTAFDQASAWRRLALIAAGMVLMVVIWGVGRVWGERALAWLALGCAPAAGLLGAYFMLSFDWAGNGVKKLPGLYQVGLWIQATRPAVPVPENLHPNVAASGLSLLICLGAGGLIWLWLRRRGWVHKLLAALAALALAAAGLALVFTVARGAWLGLVAGILAAAYRRWQSRGQHSATARWLVRALAAVAVIGMAVALWLALTSSAFTPAGGGSNTVVNRLALWQHALDLIRDYPFTGSGLGSTMMVHAVYVMLIHVGFIPHMHNLFLQIAIEQGIFGLAAFLILLALALWRAWLAARSSGGILALAAAAAAIAMIVHGLADAGLYASRMVPLMFLPIGFGLGLTRPDPTPARRRLMPAILIVALSPAIALLLLLPFTRAAWQANLGAVEQSRIELSRYHWPKPRFIDQVRRESASDLAPAIAHYRAALALNPGQATANRRLGQIELSLGEYEAARQHLQRAYQTAPGQQATRASLGESYAIAGQSDEAIRLWRSVSNQLWWDFDWLLQQSLQLRWAWYRSLRENKRAEGIRQAGIEMGFKIGR